MSIACPAPRLSIGEGQAVARKSPTELKHTSVLLFVYERRCRQHIRNHTEHVFAPFYEDASRDFISVQRVKAGT